MSFAKAGVEAAGKGTSNEVAPNPKRIKVAGKGTQYSRAKWGEARMVKEATDRFPPRNAKT